MPPPDDLVRLSAYELELAAHVGIRRHVSAVLAARPDRHGFTGDGWGVHIEGACGELAFAKRVGRFWAGSFDTFREIPDVGEFEIRTRSRHDYDLMIRPDDDPAKCYVLVTGAAPVFWVRGWIWGRDAQRAAWWARHGGRPGAWFVPPAELRPMPQMQRAPGGK